MTQVGWLSRADREVAAREIARVLEAGMAAEVEAAHSRTEFGHRRTVGCDVLLIHAVGAGRPPAP